MLSNLYCTLDALRARVTIRPGERTDVNGAMLDIIANVSRQIDLWCGRHFYVVTGTRHFTYRPVPAWDFDVMVDDLVRLDTLATDPDGDRSYGDLWTAATDYELGPSNAPFQSPPGPYWQLSRRSDGAFDFPVGRRGLQLTGRWGYYEVLERSTATVAEAVDSSEIVIDVSDATVFQIGQTILVDAEQMFVTGTNTAATPDNITVAPRVGLNGTTPATHLSGAAIDVYTYPVVSESCLTQCQRRFERTIGRPGNRGTEEAGLRAFASLDRDVQDALVLFRRAGV